jgi:LysR family transcriptional regulator, glycine cleavage system transcriptional activator
LARRTLPPLTALRAFEAFARLGRMTAAADELCVTHGAVSRQIRSLEEVLALRLTEGPRHRLQLTEAGQRLAVTLTGAFDRMERTLTDLRQAGARELHLSCVGTFAMRWLIPRLPAFQALNPQVRVKVTEAHEPVDFARQRFDAAIRIAEHAGGPGTEAVAFLDNFHGPVTAPALAEGRDPVALLAQPRLHTEARPAAWAEWAGHAGLALPPAAEDRQFEHIFYMLEAAAAGLGVGLSPWVYVAGDIASGRLAAPLGFVRTPARFWLLLPSEGVKPAALAFRDWLSAEAAQAPEPPPRAA